MTDMEPTSLDLLRAVLDPVRLAVLGSSIGEPVSLAAIEKRTGATRREVAEAIGALRSAGFLDAEGRAVPEALRQIAMDLPSDRTEPGSIVGPWTPAEADVLARFFDGDRLRSIPSNISKRRLVLERIAQDFEPGVRYHERDVNFRIQLVFSDYAAIRRYLIDEGFMDRADGSYWRTGGRHETATPTSPVADASVLDTEMSGVELRQYTDDMAMDLVIAANHPEISRFMSDRFPYPYTLTAASEWIAFTREEPEPQNYAVFLGDELVGGVGAAHLGLERTGAYEIGWWLTPSHWRRGITSAAVRTLIAELFGVRGAMKVRAPVMAPNTASAAVASKVGMQLEGTQRQLFLKGGVRHDQLDFGMTRDQWASP